MCHDKAKTSGKKIHFSLNVLFFFPVEDSRIIFFIHKLYDIPRSNDISLEKWWLVSIHMEALLLRYLWESPITLSSPWLQLGYFRHYLYSLVFAVFLMLYRSLWCFAYSLPAMYSVWKSFFNSGFTGSWNFVWPYVFKYLLPYIFMHVDTWS